MRGYKNCLKWLWFRREYVCNYTCEIYTGLRGVIIGTISNMVHFPKCRTIKMLDIKPYIW